MQLDHEKQLNEHGQAMNDAILRREPVQLQIEERSKAIRQVGIESSPRDPTDAELDAVVVKPPPLPRMLGNPLADHAQTPFLAGSKRSVGNLVQTFSARLGPAAVSRDRSRSPYAGRRETICTHYIRGECHFGFRCRFSHDQSALSSHSKSPRCCYFLQGKCRFGPECDFVHGYSGRGCHFGTSCWFEHGS